MNVVKQTRVSRRLREMQVVNTPNKKLDQFFIKLLRTLSQTVKSPQRFGNPVLLAITVDVNARWQSEPNILRKLGCEKSLRNIGVIDRET